ncbi:hypothetical protein C5Y96_11740 [Blastopirellula marina]|uniref:Uncharacterized protein n=1 Tax=Blastopirellula marina TaxID=124 RepID=A0A2S8FMS6_9BACT|nr:MULTISPECIES: hypothetical protein [Pirellulaceae]PQO33499.1 hypothetical protein C5Y96_11740 [Blastopirellula marina]RCS52590.1 hypothetical protein DTL36_11750 [Bremerella cremea]
MFPFHMPSQVWWFAALLYLCAMLSVVWVRFARESANVQLAQFTSVTCFLVLTVHLVHEITSGSGFWLGGSIVYVVLAVTCVFEPSATKPTRQI